MSANKLKTGIVLVQVGTPNSPKIKDLREFLRTFLGDPRLVDRKSFKWKCILNTFILPFRPYKIKPLYDVIWQGNVFPLVKYTENFSNKVATSIQGKIPEMFDVRHAFIIGTPSVRQQVESLVKVGINNFIFVPQFPQFAEATTLSALDAVRKAVLGFNQIQHTQFIYQYNTYSPFIKSTVAQIKKVLSKTAVEKLLLSFHGYPIRRITLGDPYFDQCTQSFNAIVDELEHQNIIDRDNVILSFQSQFGREEWISPDIVDVVKSLAQDGVSSIAAHCPGFLVDCLETEDEIANGVKEIFEENGGNEFHFIPCLNANTDWAEHFATDVINPKSELFNHLYVDIHKPSFPKTTVPFEKLINRAT